MIEELKTKTQPVSKEQVWSAWKRIKQGGKGMGVDHVSIGMIESQIHVNTCILCGTDLPVGVIFRHR